MLNILYFSTFRNLVEFFLHMTCTNLSKNKAKNPSRDDIWIHEGNMGIWPSCTKTEIPNSLKYDLSQRKQHVFRNILQKPWRKLI